MSIVDLTANIMQSKNTCFIMISLQFICNIYFQQFDDLFILVSYEDHYNDIMAVISIICYLLYLM
jgi:hypothetical protein